MSCRRKPASRAYAKTALLNLNEYIIAYLVPAGMNAGSIPCTTYCHPGGISGYCAYDIFDRMPSKRIVSFAGSRWLVWSKPTFAQPLTSVEPNRTWSALITTGGQDQSATRIMAFLLPKGKGPHLANGRTGIPAAAYTDAVAWDEVLRK